MCEEVIMKKIKYVITNLLGNLFTKKLDDYDKWLELHPDFFLEYDEDVENGK